MRNAVVVAPRTRLDGPRSRLVALPGPFHAHSRPIPDVFSSLLIRRRAFDGVVGVMTLPDVSSMLVLSRRVNPVHFVN